MGRNQGRRGRNGTGRVLGQRKKLCLTREIRRRSIPTTDLYWFAIDLFSIDYSIKYNFVVNSVSLVAVSIVALIWTNKFLASEAPGFICCVHFDHFKHLAKSIVELYNTPPAWTWLILKILCWWNSVICHNSACIEFNCRLKFYRINTSSLFETEATVVDDMEFAAAVLTGCLPGAAAPPADESNTWL